MAHDGLEGPVSDEPPEERIARLEEALEAERARSLAISIESEQKCVKIEEKYEGILAENQKLCRDVENLQRAVQQREVALQEEQNALRRAQRNMVEEKARGELLATNFSHEQATLRETRKLLERKTGELEEVNILVKSYIEKIVLLTSEKSSAESKTSILESEKRRIAGGLQKVEQEKVILEKHIEWLREDLSRKNTALRQESQARQESEEHLRMSLQQANTSLKDARAESQRNMERLRAVEKQREELQEELNRRAEEEASRETSLIAECSTAKKLAELYKEAADQASARAATLQDSLQVLEEREKSHKLAFQAELEAVVQSREELRERCESLEEQLKKAQEQSVTEYQKPPSIPSPRLQLEDEGQASLDQVNPHMLPLVPPSVSGAALAALLIKDGWTLTTMFKKYEEVADALRHEKHQRRHSESLLQQVLQDIEEKAAGVLAEREDNEKLLAAFESSSAKLQEASGECRDLRKQVGQLKALACERDLEIQVLHADIADLQEQVAVLLSELNQQAISTSLASFAPDNHMGRDNVPVPDILSIIQERSHLLHDLRLLKLESQQTVNLLKVQMEDELERRSAANAAEVQDVLVRLKEQEVIVKKLQEQRDFFKQEYTEAVKASRKQDEYPLAPLDAVQVPDYKARFEAVQEELKHIRDDTKAHLTELQSILDSERVTAREARLSASRAEAALASSQDKIKELQAALNYERSAREEAITRSSEFSASILQHQIQLREAEHRISAALEKTSLLEAEVVTLRSEREILSSAEARAAEEANSNLKDCHRLQVTLDTLEAAHAAKEAGWIAENSRLEAALARLEAEWADAQRSLADERAHSRDLSVGKERLLVMLEQQKSDAVIAEQSLKQALADSNEQIEALTKEISELKRDAESRMRKDSGLSLESGQQDELRALHEQLVRLQDELKSAYQHLDQYKSICEATESAVQQLSIEKETLKETLEAEASLAAKRGQVLEERLKQLEETLSERMAQEEEAQKNREILHEKEQYARSKLESECADLRRQLEDASKRMTEAIEREKLATAKSQTAQENYERQVLMQADTIRQLDSVHQGLRKSEEQLKQLKVEAVKESSEQQSQLKLLTAQAAVAEKALKTAEAKVQDLQQQNTQLVNKLESIICSPAGGLNTPGASGLAGSLPENQHGREKNDEEHASRPGDLHDIVSYLRRTREAAEVEISLLKQERLRLSKQVDDAGNQIEKLKTQLHEERARGQRVEQGNAQAAVEQQANQARLLQESNIVLRQETEKHHAEALQWRQKAEQLSSDVSVLQASLALKQTEIAAAEKEVVSARQESQRWQARVRQLLDKYKAIDVEDYQRLQDELQVLKVELASSQSRCSTMEESIAEAASRVATLQKEKAEAYADASKAADEAKRTQAELVAVKEKLTAAIEAEAKMKSDFLKLKNTALKNKRYQEQLGKQLEEQKATAEALRKEKQAVAEGHVKAVEDSKKLALERGREVAALRLRLSEVEKQLTAQQRAADEAGRALEMHLQAAASTATGQRANEGATAARIQALQLQVSSEREKRMKQAKFISESVMRARENFNAVTARLKDVDDWLENFKKTVPVSIASDQQNLLAEPPALGAARDSYQKFALLIEQMQHQSAAAHPDQEPSAVHSEKEVVVQPTMESQLDPGEHKTPEQPAKMATEGASRLEGEPMAVEAVQDAPEPSSEIIAAPVVEIQQPGVEPSVRLEGHAEPAAGVAAEVVGGKHLVEEQASKASKAPPFNSTVESGSLTTVHALEKGATQVSGADSVPSSQKQVSSASTSPFGEGLSTSEAFQNLPSQIMVGEAPGSNDDPHVTTHSIGAPPSTNLQAEAPQPMDLSCSTVTTAVTTTDLPASDDKPISERVHHEVPVGDEPVPSTTHDSEPTDIPLPSGKAEATVLSALTDSPSAPPLASVDDSPLDAQDRDAGSLKLPEAKARSSRSPLELREMLLKSMKSKKAAVSASTTPQEGPSGEDGASQENLQKVQSTPVIFHEPPAKVPVSTGIPGSAATSASGLAPVPRADVGKRGGKARRIQRPTFGPSASQHQQNTSAAAGQGDEQVSLVQEAEELEVKPEEGAESTVAKGGMHQESIPVVVDAASQVPEGAHTTEEPSIATHKAFEGSGDIESLGHGKRGLEEAEQGPGKRVRSMLDGSFDDVAKDVGDDLTSPGLVAVTDAGGKSEVGADGAGMSEKVGDPLADTVETGDGLDAEGGFKDLHLPEFETNDDNAEDEQVEPTTWVPEDGEESAVVNVISAGGNTAVVPQPSNPVTDGGAEEHGVEQLPSVVDAGTSGGGNAGAPLDGRSTAGGSVTTADVESAGNGQRTRQRLARIARSRGTVSSPRGGTRIARSRSRGRGRTTRGSS